ncbi:hypothetical protein [Actinomadura kijaniata]|uniref:hypothetical protein n=1 Tax=Actinomadura kijaniata TaxID=46161 RepID=UPI0012FA623F|nr:hypothetical protein [Actinomadura kijaniata]
MLRTRPDSRPVVVVLSLVFGGAVATGAMAVTTVARMYTSDFLREFRDSLGFVVLQCLLVGLLVGVALLVVRSRSLVLPAVAAVVALVALYVGASFGFLLAPLVTGHGPSLRFAAPWRPAFSLTLLVAPGVAALLSGLRVLITRSPASRAGGAGDARP